MTTEKLIEKLTEIKNSCLKAELLNNLIIDLKNELLTADKKPSEKQRIQSCLKYLSKFVEMRPIFAFTQIKEDLQYYTDSEFIVALSSSDMMQELPEYKSGFTFKKKVFTDEEVARMQFIPLENIFKNYFEAFYTSYINLQDLYNFINANKKENIIALDYYDEKLFFNPARMKTALTFLKVDDELVKIEVKKSKNLYIEKDNGSKAIICGIRGDAESYSANIPSFKL